MRLSEQTVTANLSDELIITEFIGVCCFLYPLHSMKFIICKIHIFFSILSETSEKSLMSQLAVIRANHDYKMKNVRYIESYRKIVKVFRSVVLHNGK